MFNVELLSKNMVFVTAKVYSCSSNNVQSFFTIDGTFGWMARGSFLEAFSISNGQRLSAWSFGAAIKEPSTTITAVCECVQDYGSLLVVATCTVNPEGLICLFDPKSFKIVKAIEVPYAVSMTVINWIAGFCNVVSSYCVGFVTSLK